MLRSFFMVQSIADLCGEDGPLAEVSWGNLKKLAELSKRYCSQIVMKLYDLYVSKTSRGSWEEFWTAFFTLAGSWPNEKGKDVVDNLEDARKVLSTKLKPAIAVSEVADAAAEEGGEGEGDEEEEDDDEDEEEEDVVETATTAFTVAKAINFFSTTAVASLRPPREEDDLPVYFVPTGCMSARYLRQICDFLSFSLYEYAFRPEVMEALGQVIINFASKPPTFVVATGAGLSTRKNFNGGACLRKTLSL
jgi:hypothetical protein